MTAGVPLRTLPLTVDGTIVRYDVYPRELDYGTMVISSFAIPLLSRDTLLNEFLATPHARFDVACVDEKFAKMVAIYNL